MTSLVALMERVERLRASMKTVEQLDNQFLSQFKGVRKFDGVPAVAVTTDEHVFSVQTDLGIAYAHERQVIDGDRAKMEFRFIVKVEDLEAEVLRLYLDHSGSFTRADGSEFGPFNQASTAKDIAVAVIHGILESELYAPSPAFVTYQGVSLQ